MTPTGHEIAIALRRAYATMHRRTQALLASHEMTADQFVLLSLLADEDGVTQSVLTLRASSDPNTVRAMLVLMEGMGLVARKPHDTDRRARRVVLTDKGRRTYNKLTEVLAPLQAAMRAPFSDREAREFIDSLQQLTSAIQQWESEPDAQAVK